MKEKGREKGWWMESEGEGERKGEGEGKEGAVKHHKDRMA